MSLIKNKANNMNTAQNHGASSIPKNINDAA